MNHELKLGDGFCISAGTIRIYFSCIKMKNIEEQPWFFSGINLFQRFLSKRVFINSHHLDLKYDVFFRDLLRMILQQKFPDLQLRRMVLVLE